MRSKKFRPVLQTLEHRLTPAASLLEAALHTHINSAFISFGGGSHKWMADPSLRFQLVDTTQTIFEQSDEAITIFQGAQDTWQAELAANPGKAGALAPLIMAAAQLENIALANKSFAQSIATWQDFTLRLPVVETPPPEPEPAPNDAGMVNTMPDANSASWVTGANGLKTWNTVTGSGTPVTAGQHITIFYTGWLASNGTQFDSRRSPLPPIEFDLDGLIEGWKQGIPGMMPGGIRRLYVPAALGYGAAGSPPNIPANADLIFEIKLISSRA